MRNTIVITTLSALGVAVSASPMTTPHDIRTSPFSVPPHVFGDSPLKTIPQGAIPNNGNAPLSSSLAQACNQLQGQNLLDSESQALTTYCLQNNGQYQGSVTIPDGAVNAHFDSSPRHREPERYTGADTGSNLDKVKLSKRQIHNADYSSANGNDHIVSDTASQPASSPAPSATPAPTSQKTKRQTHGMGMEPEIPSEGMEEKEVKKTEDEGERDEKEEEDSIPKQSA